MPAVYNATRQFEAPIPRTTPPHSPTNSDVQADDMGNDPANDLMQDDEINDDNEERIGEQNDETISVQNIEGLENKPNFPLLLPNVVLNNCDLLAVNDIFDEEVIENEQFPAAYQNIELQPNETSQFENGVLKVTRKEDDGFEITYSYGEIPVPTRLAPCRFLMKRNDSISATFPFGENVSRKKKISKKYYIVTIISQENGDRVYPVEFGETFKEVTLAVRIVGGLKVLNGDNKRHDTTKDQMFVKALLVGLIGVQAIKNGDVDNYVVRFIRGKLTYFVYIMIFFLQ